MTRESLQEESSGKMFVLQAVRQVEQQIVLESLVRFMNIIDGRPTDQASLDSAKTWSLHDLEGFFQVCQLNRVCNSRRSSPAEQ